MDSIRTFIIDELRPGEKFTSSDLVGRMVASKNYPRNKVPTVAGAGLLIRRLVSDGTVVASPGRERRTYWRPTDADA